jgi:Fic family protein
LLDVWPLPSQAGTEDGNGRIARAIADMALARADGRPERFYSMSSQIESERRDYYYAKLTGCSTDTALRDIQGLLDLGALVRNPGGGRSVSYRLTD